MTKPIDGILNTELDSCGHCVKRGLYYYCSKAHAINPELYTENGSVNDEMCTKDNWRSCPLNSYRDMR